ncbi:hypothetical protein CH63R_00272 [Colletotrichum higginsianum IMI 349063]|uniref:Uncharacterized protein n=3 Tax=Colletotrichum higginsianum TaxID=80884 RepID=A0A1B7YT11_COLHI|nr:hypothetical protein CH63R_00272 [Colletotrichum higginsianum IMI 349063]OBR15092.1 hypothetical protein CH63R_00272 [Colletotrichum higginsianum IMI 349063]TID04791.1 hypothetical protein CH35J_003081 [Colletotrichum higginsianum]
MLVFRRLIPYALMVSLGAQAEAGEDSPPGLPPLPDRTNRTSNNVRDAVVHANATGSWPFRGIDITKPMDHPPDDEVGEGNGWSINIAVATNTTSNTGSSSQPRGNPQYIYINAPEDAFENPDSASTSPEDWTTCAVVWLGNRWSVEEIEQLHQDPDGACNEVISEECISGLRQKLLDTGCWLWGGELPEGCPGAVSDVMVMTNTLEFSAEKHSYEVSASPGPHSNLTEVGLRAAYDEALTKVFPMMLLYQYDDGEVKSDYTVFRCILASNVTEGSREPESFGEIRSGLFGIGESSARRNPSSASWLITGLAVCLAVSFFAQLSV